MQTNNNTILITGGSAGIGLDLARSFSDLGNKIIITGRNVDRLAAAARKIPNVVAIQGDVSSPDGIDRLAERIETEFPDLNILINNAGQAYYYDIVTSGKAFENAQHEMLVNYLSPIRLTEKLLPIFRQRPAAAIVNVTSIVAIAPGLRLPTYAASKAALHSYSISLRQLLSHTQIRVFELMPPLVNTEFSEEIGGATNGIPVEDVSNALLAAMEAEDYEIHVAGTEDLYKLSLVSPQQAFKALNKLL